MDPQRRERIEPTDDWQQLALIRGMTIRKTDGGDAIDLFLQTKLPLADANSVPVLGDKTVLQLQRTAAYLRRR